MYFSNDSLNTKQSASLVRFSMLSIFFYQQGKRYKYIYIYIYIYIFYIYFMIRHSLILITAYS